MLESASWRARHWIAHKPDPSAADSQEGPLVVAGMFRTANGISEYAAGCFEALTQHSFNPVAVDTSALLDQIDSDATVPVEPMPRSKTGTLILNANAPETEILLFRLGLRRWHRWRVIGCWAWELPRLPEAWMAPARHLHEIWAPSAFCRDAFVQNGQTPVKVVPPRIFPPEDLKTKPDGGAFKIVVFADGRSSLDRKNILSAVMAFQAAFPETPDVRLILKCRNLTPFRQNITQIFRLVDQDPRIEIINETVPKSAIWHLLASSAVVLSCHRSEGFGLHLAEAMSIGKLSIATGWSGNLEFMNHDVSQLLDYALKPVEDSTGIYPSGEGYVWAECSVESAAQALRRSYADPAWRIQIGSQARRHIRERLDGSSFAAALGQPAR